MCDKNKPLIRVLSLFDGIGTGLSVLLESFQLEVDAYYSCEIDPDAMRVVEHNFGGKFISLGSVKNLRPNQKIWKKNDLIIGGSPCNDLSRVNWRRKGLDGKLFM